MRSSRLNRVFRRPEPTAAPVIWTPANVTSAVKRFWHDAQDGATLAPGVGAGISGVVDKFGNGYNVAQASGPKQPTVDTSAFGGRQSLRFTAANSQELVLTDGVRVQNFAGGVDTPYDWWLVLQFASTAGNQYFCEVDNSASAITYNLHNQSAGTWLHQRRDGVGANQQFAPANVAPAAATPFLVRLGYTGTAPAWVINGVTMTSGAVDTGSITLDRLIYGAFGNGAGAHTAFFNGWIGEGIGFTTQLAGAESILMTNYLKAKWGISF